MAKPKRIKQVSLPNKSAGMAASFVMSFAILLSIVNRQDPFQTLTLAVLSGAISGVIGYWIGIVMDSPSKTGALQKKQATKQPRNTQKKKTPELSDDYAPLGNVTGEETFLDDLVNETTTGPIN